MTNGVQKYFKQKGHPESKHAPRAFCVNKGFVLEHRLVPKFKHKTINTFFLIEKGMSTHVEYIYI